MRQQHKGLVTFLQLEKHQAFMEILNLHNMYQFVL